ncbi:MAG: PPOX class F420-dependent oxidoreductase [Janthinobacterium lividum]
MADARVHQLLASTRYVSLTTFRKDGRAVPSPLWIASSGFRLVMVTGTQTGKIKRLRREERVLVAPCTARGRAFGESVEARGRLLDPADNATVAMAMIAKYGWQFRAVRGIETVLQSWGRFDGDFTAIELRL